MKFADALSAITSQKGGMATSQDARSGQYGTSNTGHMPMVQMPSIGERSTLGYAVQTQPSLDNNSVDLNRERAAFTDNAIRYEATLRFINGNAKTMLSAIQGQ